MKIIQQRQRITRVEYSLEYEANDNPQCGFGFPCDEQGNLLPLSDGALENYQRCTTGVYDVTCMGVRKITHTYVEPAVVICECCGAKVYLESFTNTCDTCDSDYNISGQLLAPRSQWGEETGEYLGDILRIK